MALLFQISLIAFVVLGTTYLGIEYVGMLLRPPVDKNYPIYWRVRRLSHRIIVIALFALPPVAFTCIALLFRSQPHQADHLLNWALLHSATARRPVVVAIVVLVGRLASIWKRYNQQTYGVGEVIFATFGCFNVLYLARQLDLALLLGVGGFMYVVSRGFNNVSEAWEKERPRAEGESDGQ